MIENNNMDRDFDKRPWGEYDRFCCNEQATVKILSIKPNEQLSLQIHHKRDEFWRVIDGPLKIQIDDQVHDAVEGDEFYIKKEVKHRIITEDSPARVLEISFGHFDEHDEERLEDKYQRN